MKLRTIKLHRVEYMPKHLEPGILYVSEQFGAVAHLCACGCGSKIRTPLGPTEWALRETPAGPSLWPSVGNWQQTCQSHYIIHAGKIVWCGRWTPQQIASGRHQEEIRRIAYYEGVYAQKPLSERIWNWVKSLFSL